MDLLINIALITFGFIGALTAIVGDTWREDERSPFQRITNIGWIAIGCLSLTLGLGIVKEIRANDEAENLKAERSKLQMDLSIANDRLRETRQALVSLEPTLLEAMYKLTERIVRESDFAFISLRGESRKAPRSSETGKGLLLYGGDEFEYHLYCDYGSHGYPSRANLVLEAGSRRYPLEYESGRIRIAGPIGQAMSAFIINEQHLSKCDMKIIVHSTDRTRIEAQFRPLLKAIEQGKADSQDEFRY